jgi:purine-binding chemotaxis protein CheW
MNPQDSTLTADGLLVAAFLLGGAAYGVDARQVQEVVKPGEITHVHRAPPGVVGIRNLRGRIVTVIDLRVSLELGRVDPSQDNRVLIVDAHGETTGLLVDAVEDAFSTTVEEMSPPPPNLPRAQGRCVQGVCRSGSRLVSLLDLGVLLESDERGPRDPAPNRAA